MNIQYIPLRVLIDYREFKFDWNNTDVVYIGNKILFTNGMRVKFKNLLYVLRKTINGISAEKRGISVIEKGVRGLLLRNKIFGNLIYYGTGKNKNGLYLFAYLDIKKKTHVVDFVYVEDKWILNHKLRSTPVGFNQEFLKKRRVKWQQENNPQLQL